MPISLSRWSRGALAVAVSAGWAVSAQAELPTQQQEQAPGWFRMMVGEYEVTALYDGHTAIDTSLLKGMEQEEILRHWMRYLSMQRVACKLRSMPFLFTLARTLCWLMPAQLPALAPH